ncbi:Fe-S cluster domain-containing protein [Bacteroidales bacterium OttesenSCG-928-L03]|nr:Fe-S cluster domain-containing protein [Bacteroidales bacterium OttesenSCG-928-L03]
MSTVLVSVIVLGVIGCLGALVLYWAAKKFYVEEDPRIGQVQEILPAANCGGCGYPGCAGFAEALVKSDSMEGFNCPVGGAAVMSQAAEILGRSVESAAPMIAVLRCNGSCENRPRMNRYDGVSSCAIASNLYGGETACSYGCLGLGDCVKVCPFDAIHVNPETQLPEVDEDKCTACGKCVKACPKLLLQLRKKGPKSRRIYVSCMNQDKAAAAQKSCKVACISCKKCQKACAFEAITIENNLAYIDDNKCRLCRKCVTECPNSTIIELNFPVKKHVENV